MSDAGEFFDAVRAGLIDRVGQALASDPSLVHARDADGATALHHAAFQGHTHLARLLIASGADVNARDGEHDATPSGWAMHYLRELGGLLTIEIEDASYAIETRDSVWAARLVRRHPALVNAVDRDGTSLAARAHRTGIPEIVELFAHSIHVHRT